MRHIVFECFSFCHTAGNYLEVIPASTQLSGDGRGGGSVRKVLAVQV